jgi:hypothetical protein
MARTLSTAAQAAKMIRSQLKAANIEATVTNSRSGSLKVLLTGDPMPSTVAAVRSELSKYQHGQMDPMTDYFDESVGRRSDVPQVRFLFINVEYSDEIHQRAWDFLRSTMAGWADCPADYQELNYRHQNSDTGNNAQQEVMEVLSGRVDEKRRNLPAQYRFWATMKPRVKAAA